MMSTTMQATSAVVGLLAVIGFAALCPTPPISAQQRIELDTGSSRMIEGSVNRGSSRHYVLNLARTGRLFIDEAKVNFRPLFRFYKPNGALLAEVTLHDIRQGLIVTEPGNYKFEVEYRNESGHRARGHFYLRLKVMADDH